MATNDVAVRALAAADLAAVGRVHKHAFPKSALGSLGSEAIRRYYVWLLEGPHRSTCIGAFEQETLLGFLFGGTFNGAMSGFLRANRGYLAKYVATHPWVIVSPLVRDRIRLALRLLRRRPPPAATSEPKPPEFGVLAIAVDPAAQGRGVGAALMGYAEGVAKRDGFADMQLTVAGWNEQAIQFYLSRGWLKVGAPWVGAMKKKIT